MLRRDEISDWLRLINTDGIGAVGSAKLMAAHGTAGAALEFLAAGGKKIPSREWAEREMAQADEQQVKIILKKDSLYPQSLLQIHDAPPVLYVKGQLRLLSARKAIAVVGSRSASLNARRLTEKIAYDLSESQVLVVSGMARGIDAAAHLGAMEAQNGKGPTVAVLGTGIDRIYPPENRDLYYRIAEQGLLLTEVPFAGEAVAAGFPRRNRIVAGLSRGVLVTEASEKSGSLITARFAAKQKKTIFAVPGSPSDPRAAGPNRLLKAGAVLTEKAEDILKMLKNTANSPAAENLSGFCGDLFTKPLDNYAKTADIPTCPHLPIADFLSAAPADIDEIIRCSGLDAATVMMQILDLELSGRIIRLPGNKIALSGSKKEENRQ